MKPPVLPHAEATLPIGKGEISSVDRFSLVVVEGPDAGKTWSEEASEVGIGTEPGNQLVVSDATVSRHHCSITSTARGFVLRDLGSTNGTRVGGCRVEVGLLSDGAVLELGHTKVRFTRLDEPIFQPLSAGDRFGAVLGKSAAMRRLFALLPRIAPSESTVLLEGETGTGKGRLAEAIHEASPRAKGPFVILDCGAIPATLVESELFGHEKGAFTGAHADRAGAFEQADGGTVFLDEIGELPSDMQPKLLRAIEERTVKRVGGNKRIKLDVRIVAATNRDLRAEVNKGTFRADLYFRLDVVRLVVPPLRERKEDVALLARYFWAELSGGKAAPDAVVAELARQSWPGNVRELRSAVERTILFGGLDPRGDGEAAPTSAPIETTFDPALSFRAAKERAVGAWEAGWLGALLAHVGGNLSEAARLASMDRSHLRDLLKKYGLHGSG